MRYNVPQGALCDVSTELLHMIQGFGRLVCIKVLNKDQAVMHFKFFIPIS